MKRSEIIDYIKSYASKFTFGCQASYETLPDSTDLVDEDIPAWRNVTDAIDASSGVTEQVFIDTQPKLYTYTGDKSFPETYFSIANNTKPWYPDFDYDPGTKIVTIDLPVSDNYTMYIK